MVKKVIVLSLGGSLIIPNDINITYLKKFKRVILKHKRKYKFIIVCGGGDLARKYISALASVGMSIKFQGFSGISATRMNARFISYFFNQDQKRGIPHTIPELKRYAKEYDLVFCGGLEYRTNQTSDSTAAEIAQHLKAKFVNLTNVQGLYDKNPSKFRNAKFIPEISWDAFDKMANKLKFHPGQHFVLDQTASGMIKKSKITTYILGEDLKQLDALLSNKKFKGTKIQG
jgi:uridylate kinase